MIYLTKIQFIVYPYGVNRQWMMHMQDYYTAYAAGTI